MFTRMSPRTTLFVCVTVLSLTLVNRAWAQTTTTPQQNININQILQSLGGLGGLGALTGSSTGTSTGTATSQPSTGQSQMAPSIITNQFTTTETSAIRQRRPGLFIEQAIALQNGQLTLPGTPAPVEPNFLRDTADQVALAVINVIKGVITSINASISLLSGVPSTGTTTGTTIANPATTGAGTTTTIQ